MRIIDCDANFIGLLRLRVLVPRCVFLRRVLWPSVLGSGPRVLIGSGGVSPRELGRQERSNSDVDFEILGDRGFGR